MRSNLHTGQPLSLHKACICFTLFPQYCAGSRPADYITKSSDLLSLFIGPNSGLELITDVSIFYTLHFAYKEDIPQGSGLGTSSILILTAIRALKSLFGGQIANTKTEQNKEFNAVLAIEQMLTTGGGWQDQIGGGVVGLKFITAEAAVIPDYNVDFLKLSQKHVECYNDRLLVVWTGKTRMAKTILTNVVDNWYMRKQGVPEALFGILSN
jgi:fucokinase